MSTMDNHEGHPEQDQNGHRERKKQLLALAIGLCLCVVLGIAFYRFASFSNTPLQQAIPYSEFKARLREGQILEATISDTRIVGKMANTQSNAAAGSATRFVTQIIPTGDPELVHDLEAAGVKYSASGLSTTNTGIIAVWLTAAAVLGGIWLMTRQKNTGVRRRIDSLERVSQSRATQVEAKDTMTTFDDVGGVDEAITELQEIIDFLKNPQKFAHLGGRVPKGILLVGSPGTGKTLLAKATAGEAHAPFFESSGSEFVEMFVGVGAARVRDLFERARKAAPAIIFIDEIDAIGQSRTESISLGGNDEREQTLNQLLAEMDGFKTDASAPVVIMAATNRPEVLDPALLRAGRFDRQVVVPQPDLTGRLQILRIHSQNIRLAEDFDQERAARITSGFSGADLANALNEAALLAGRREADAVTLADFEAALERTVAGLERKTRLMNETERKTVAYHEIGHALVAALVPHADPVAKISIIPRGRGALGYTLQMPTEDRYILTQEELEDRISVMMGGRAAEKVILGTISTGASDDIQRATELARRMVAEFGMSEALGPVRYAGRQLQYLAGKSQDTSLAGAHSDLNVSEEVKRIVSGQYERAQELLKSHLDALDRLAKLLLERETLNGDIVTQALQGYPVL
jgi:cell division protease FtsH